MATSPGFLSRLSLWWIGELVYSGYKKVLTLDDLWETRSNDAPQLVSEKFLTGYLAQQDPGKRSMFWSVIRLVKFDLFLSFLYFFVYSVLRFAGPFLLQKIVEFVQEDPPVSPTYQGYLYAAGLFASQILVTFCQAKSNYLGFSVGLRIKNALIGATFRHTMHLNNAGRQQTTQGQVVNLVSTDSHMVVEFMRFINQFWSAPLVLFGGVLYIYLIIGWPIFAGLAIMVLFVPLSMKMGKIQTHIQNKKMKATDSRIKFTNEALQGIKVLKLYAWEDAVQDRLDSVRNAELAELRKLQYYRAFTIPVAITIPNIASVVTFSVYALTGKILSPADTFAVVSLFVIIRSPFITFPLAITMISRILVSFRRFSEFFDLPTQTPLQQAQNVDDSIAIKMQDAAFDWLVGDLAFDDASSDTLKRSSSSSSSSSSSPAPQQGATELENPVVKTPSFKDLASPPTDVMQPTSAATLSNINMVVKKGELVAVCGRVASGKSSFCSAVLNEMTKVSGTTYVSGSVAYCGQEAFIMNATVRDNILFGKPYDARHYRSTLKACALKSDLKLLPAGDFTEIGERGINLSGGQKARISLARAVYANADIYVLDDPLSAVDAHVGKYIFNNCLSNSDKSVLRGKTRILVTNNLNVLEPYQTKSGDTYPGVDRIITLADGTIQEDGSFAELMRDSDGVLAQLMKDMGSVSAADGDPQTDDTELAALEELENDNDDDEHVDVGEDDGNRHMSSKRPGPEDSQDDASSQYQRAALTNVSDDASDADADLKEKGKITGKEMQATGAMNFSVYKTYFLSGTNGSVMLTCLLLSSFLAAEAAFLSIDSWLAVWSAATEEELKNNATDAQIMESNQTFIQTYIILTAVFFVVILVRSFGFAKFSVVAAQELHERLLHHVLFLPMSFFWKTPMGRVLNRFSKDVNDIDVILPQSWQWFIMTLARVLGILVLIIIAAPIFAAFLIPLMFLYLLIREFYRRTARELQRIESVQRSPVYNHLGETFIGTSTIRAYNRISDWISIADSRQSQNHRAKYAVEATQIWLSLNLEMLGALIVLLCSVAIVATKDSVDPGLAGLAIAYSLNIVINLNMSVRNATLVEAQMNCVERVVEYGDVPLEVEDRTGQDDDGDGDDDSGDGDAAASLADLDVVVSDDVVDDGGVVDESWPSAGGIEFKDVYFRYKTSLEPALRGLSLSIDPGEFVGLVGRTGAGKSSIMVAIFRLVDVYRGSICIDGVNTKAVSRKRLRSSVTMIPQDPVLFIGTIRYNLDPFNQYTDAQVWNAVDQAHLRKMVESMPGGLEASVTENGENISVGERALICLGRALLRKTKLVLFDEATAAVDASTDALIQATIRKEFNDATCLVIAHRLNTVIDADRIVVLGAGKIVEHGTPAQLLAQKNGAFRALVDETGEENAKKLIQSTKKSVRRLSA